MLQPCIFPVALAALLMDLPAAAQAAPVEGPAPRSIVLTGKAGESPLLYLAPGTFTFILLDAPILRESVEVEDRARFARVDPSDQGITLALRAPLAPTERLALRFTYREGSPSSTVFLLTGRVGEADIVVNVSRPPQTVEACRAELSVTREHCEAQGKELEALRARSLTVSPAAVALAELVDKEGMKTGNFKESCLDAPGEFRPTRCRALGASAWTVFVFEVSNGGEAPWAPAWAEVTPDSGGVPRRARAVLARRATVLPGEEVSVAVEVEMPVRKPQEWLEAPHALRLCDAAGSRCLSLSRVLL
ncbi:DUF2381 family protein [Stigmatella aurantiaca]|uniref:Myxococcus xanthus paralogous family TIGR02268 n=2 Tax=Stigmatella aurantiaca (strain DW4/3-1) TaxID=378806 RepID=Q091D2_STIAD|nr:DUF2381 family protein [Stigmatella aurantiaca]EAU66380.1 hypothetical protein STIAU_1094 [Stigmatella aurantiaca DW4/3-1]